MSAMEARQYVAAALMSRLKWEFCEQSSFASFTFGAPASTHFFCGRASTKGWNGARASLSNGPAAAPAGGGAGNSLSREINKEGSVLQDISSLFCSCEKLKAMVDSSLNSGVGPDMRNRVDHLFKRVFILKGSAEQAVRIPGGRVPAQLIASFKGLQREHASLENIVRLATEAGPVLIEEDSNNQNEQRLAMAAQKSTSPTRYGAESVDLELNQGQKNEASIEVLSGPKYVMSTQPSKGSSKLNSIRAEIERRVMEQLVKKQFRQPIVNSVQDYTYGHESKSTSFQKVPSLTGQRDKKDNNVRSVAGQRDLEEKSEADTVLLAGKDPLAQMVDTKQHDQSAQLDTSKNREPRQLQMENARTVSLELHQQMVNRFENALLDLREQLSGVTENLIQKETMLVGIKEKLMGEQHTLSEKINELTKEITRKLEAEQLNYALRNALSELESNLKDTQNQVVTLSSVLEKKEELLIDFQNKQERLKQELRADVLTLEDQVSHLSEMYKDFKPQSIAMDLGSVKATMSALQNNQGLEHTKMLDWQKKLGKLEKAICANDKQIEDLITDVESRVEKREVNFILKSVMDEMEERNKQLQEQIKLIGIEQKGNDKVVGLLQEDWKTYKNELQTLTTQNDGNVQGILIELLNMKQKLTDLQEEQKHEQALITEAQRQMGVLEAKGSEMVERVCDDAGAQKDAILDEVRSLRTLVEEVVEDSFLHPGKAMKNALPVQESDAAKLDVTQLRDLINDSGKQNSSSTVSSQDKCNETSHKGAQATPDQGTASLEAFFSVMGQLIRQELKRKDAALSQNLPLIDSQNSGEPSQNGSGVTFETDNENPEQDFITLRYESSWHKAFVHYCADNCGWTEVPGLAMEEASSIKGKYWKEFKIKAARLEFVMTDGQGNWDRAPNGSNYVVEKPGIFELSAGVLKATASAK